MENDEKQALPKATGTVIAVCLACPVCESLATYTVKTIYTLVHTDPGPTAPWETPQG